MNIAIAGTGYVRLSNGILFSQHYEVIVLDINSEKIDILNRKDHPLKMFKLPSICKQKTSISKQLFISMRLIKMLIT